MSLDRVLGLITRSAWIIFAVYVVISFVRTVRQRGIKVALRNLFSLRVVLPLLALGGLAAVSASLVFIDPQNIGVVVSVVAPKGYREQPIDPVCTGFSPWPRG